MIMLKEFKSFVEKNNLIEKGDKILLALSGGVDSMVLAKLLILYSQRTSSTVNSQCQCHLSFAHCNFHLRGDDSNRDEKFVLELVGVGYRASNNGQVLELSLGYTHAIYLGLAPEIKVQTISERNQNPLIVLESCDKQLLGQVCAKIRSFRKPEPYKGKGVKFQGEIVRRKAGKSASSK